jgi:hypothetical protein
MMPAPAGVVDTRALLETVAASLVAGVGIIVIYSMAIRSATRFFEARRDERPMLALGAGILTVVMLAATAAAVVIGIVVMASK